MFASFENYIFYLDDGVRMLLPGQSVNEQYAWKHKTLKKLGGIVYRASTQMSLYFVLR
jgi:hypothetical protein